MLDDGITFSTRDFEGDLCFRCIVVFVHPQGFGLNFKNSIFDPCAENLKNVRYIITHKHKNASRFLMQSLQ